MQLEKFDENIFFTPKNEEDLKKYSDYGKLVIKVEKNFNYEEIVKLSLTITKEFSYDNNHFIFVKTDKDVF